MELFKKSFSFLDDIKVKEKKVFTIFINSVTSNGMCYFIRFY